MKPWKTKARKTILDNTPWLTVEHHTVELPDGQVISEWPWVKTPDYVNVVAVTDAGKFLCFRQVKYGIEGVTLSIVGGYINEAKSRLLPRSGSYWKRLGTNLLIGSRWAAISSTQIAGSPPGIYSSQAGRVTSHRKMQTISKNRK